VLQTAVRAKKYKPYNEKRNDNNGVYSKIIIKKNPEIGLNKLK
jgi:hypothetical protein